MVLYVHAKFHVQNISGSWDIGEKGSKMGFFGHFLKIYEWIWFILLVKEEIIILHRCTKFQVQANFRSRDIGSIGGQNGSKMVFWRFPPKLSQRFGSFFCWRNILWFYIRRIWFFLLVKEDIMISFHMCGKFHVKANLCSPRFWVLRGTKRKRTR